MASPLIGMALRSERQHQQHRYVKRHISAARAFHTGLIAETYRHLHALQKMAPFIEILRHPDRRPHEKLAAATASCRELKALERMRQPWRDTYRDFRHSIQRAQAVLQSMVEPKTRARLAR
jgi:hypothetical protein